MFRQAPVAMVTGAASTLGRAVCKRLASEGFDLLLHYGRSRGKTMVLAGELAASGARVRLVRLNLARPALAASGLKKTLRRVGRLDLLVNNASRFDATPAGNGVSPLWEEMFRVNAIAPYALSVAAAEPWLRRSRGAVVNITDIYADTPLLREHSAYCASKAALVNLTKSLAMTLAPDVRVNAVSPGAITFPKGYDAGRKRALINKSALKKQGTPHDIAEAVWALASNRFITGQVLRVDGGRF
jgi:pteridine reductase